MSEHSVPEIEELIGAYALDAVDDDERNAVEQHLAVCARCRAELVEHREVAALLAYEGAPAPSDVWDRIVVTLEEPPPAMRLKVDSPGDVIPLDSHRGAKRRRGDLHRGRRCRGCHRVGPRHRGRSPARRQLGPSGVEHAGRASAVHAGIHDRNVAPTRG